MTDVHDHCIEQRRQFTRGLDATLVARGVLQRFFISPVKPMEPLRPETVLDAWQRLATQIRAGRAPELLSLYVHIPFCAHRCRYCIYYSVEPAGAEQVEAYLKRLYDEIDYYAAGLSGIEFTNCYIGGGTPTVLEDEPLDALLTHLEGAFPRKRGGEWSFECNPATVTETKAGLFRKHGFNRVSFGVQSLSSRVLAGVGRGYQTRQQVVETIRIMKRYNFWINVDLIQGLPGQTSSSLLESLKELLALEPTQVTIYGLSPYTPMALAPDGRESLASVIPEVEALGRTFGYKCDAGSTALSLGFGESKPSGTVREGSPGRMNNRLYAEHQQYDTWHNYDDTTVESFSLLGLGPTARSYVYGQLRYTNNRGPVESPWTVNAPQVSGRSVDMDEERRRYVVAALERQGGVQLKAYEARFGAPLADHFGEALRRGLALGLLAEDSGRIRIQPPEPPERFTAALLFVDDATVTIALREMIAAGDPKTTSGADGRPEGAANGEDLALTLYTGGQKVVVLLTSHWPGRRSYHHRGDFAFYLPSRLPEGSCESGDLYARLLAAFIRVFDRVVVRESPTDLQDLHRRLLAHTGR